jgi:branched-chain amino acid transport system permease protein
VEDFITFTILGISLAATYAVAASGLVVTYTTSGIFNFAHGAIGAFGAFAYWQLLDWDVPELPAVAIVLLVVAPAVGWLIERVIMRGLQNVSEVIRIVVPIGLLFGMIALIPIIWDPASNSYVVEPFFGDSKVTIFGAGVRYHQLLTIVVAGVVAVGLRFFLFGTRSGVAMRAVVDDRPLAVLNGSRPDRSSSLSWSLGCSLAALSGILVASILSMEVVTLTFLVVNAYAAAVVGRLASLPRTFLGALILGLLQSYAVGYLRDNPSFLPDDVDLITNLRLAVPVIMLFVVLLAIPHAQLRAHGLIRSREVVPRPDVVRSAIGGVVLVAVVAVVSGFLSGSDLLSWSRGLALALIMLSLVPLIGYGGQISLAPMTFAGLGGFAVARWGDGSVLGLVAAVVLSALVGLLVSLPALRLRGIYLALSTLAFAYFVEKVVFTQRALFPTTALPVERLGPVQGDRAYMIFLAVAFSLVGLLVVWIRLGPFGRRLQAMKDSPAACATLGLNLTRTKMQVFALSAGIAGLGGALLAGVSENMSVEEYFAVQNLPVLLMAVVGGIAYVSGSLVGGLLLASFAIIGQWVPTFEVAGMDGQDLVDDLLLLMPALAGLNLGRNPNGVVNEVGRQLRERRQRREEERVEPPERFASPTSLRHSLDAESLGVDRPFTVEELAVLDRALDLRDLEEELSRGTA